MTATDLDRRRVFAKVEYRGRTYYVIAECRRLGRCLLTTLDGLAPFWADMAVCELVRVYEGRKVWDGRWHSSRTVTVYPTVGSLRRFRDQQANPATARYACLECGSWCDPGEPCRDCGGC